MTGPSEARAALERGGRVVLVTPPAPEQAGVVWELVGPAAPPRRGPGVRAIILTPDRAAALDWAATAPSGHAVHPVTGLDRAARLLKEGAVDVLAGSLDDLGALMSRAALKPGGKVAALEFVPNDDRVTPPAAAGFSMTMLATTAAGDAYTLRQYDEMYRAAGFADVVGHPVPNGPETAVIGRAV